MLKKSLAVLLTSAILALIFICAICATNENVHATDLEEATIASPTPTLTPRSDKMNKEKSVSKEHNNETLESDISEEMSEDNEFFITLCLLTYAESGFEPEEGQVAVAATILNRISSEEFPNTLEGVMNQRNQFSSVENGVIYNKCNNPYVLKYSEVPEVTKRAVRKATEGQDPTEQLLKEEAYRLGLDEDEFAEGGALYFYNPRGCGEEELKKRENIQVKIEIGNHTFYKVWG